MLAFIFSYLHKQRLNIARQLEIKVTPQTTLYKSKCRKFFFKNYSLLNHCKIKNGESMNSSVNFIAETNTALAACLRYCRDSQP